jgi:hypothetical protein
MAQLRHTGAQRKAEGILEDTVDLRRSMRHDERFQAISNQAIDTLSALERRAAEIVTVENAVDCSLTSRGEDELRRRAAEGSEGALAERCRRSALPAAA